VTDAAVDQPAAHTPVPFAGAELVPPTRISGGYTWPECPRWHDGAFWFSDMYTHRLLRLAQNNDDENGTEVVVIDASDRTSVNGTEVVLGGFGWLPDGRIIVTSMHERLVLVWDGEQLAQYADLGGLATGPVNDMVVDADGRAYVTQLGFELFQGEAPKDSSLLVVEPDGTASAMIDLGPFSGANGIALSADGSRLVTAEADAHRITVLDRSEDGRLGNRRVFAETPSLPDGLCLDAEGAVWVCMPGVGAARVLEGGTFTHLVPVAPDQGLSPACVLGGPDRRTLYITAGLEVLDWAESRRSRLGTVWTAPAPVSAGDARP
jgi:sugar lactone lactonase YvrE